MKRKSNRLISRTISAVCTVVMVLSLFVTMPVQTVHGEERTQVTVSGAADSSKPVYVKVEAAGTIEAYSGNNWPTKQITKYNVTIVNNSGSTISDWQLTIACSKLEDVEAKWGWNGTTFSGNNIIVGTYKGYGDDGAEWTNAQIVSGSMASGAGFMVYTDNMENATYTLTYYVGNTSGTVSQDDTGTSSGGGSSSGSGEVFDGSNIGTIDTSKDYNFAKLLQLSLYFYDANMCGEGVSENSLYSNELYGGWRGDCHTNDSFTYNGTTYSATGGYHDAGDHVKFGLPMAEAMTTLGVGYYEFKEAYEDLGQSDHLKRIVDYYCDYVKKCTVIENGAVVAFCYQVGSGQKDHDNWTSPEVEDESATNRSYTLVATSGNPATDIVSETAAALTLNYLNFGDETDLEYAKKLFAFATNNNKATAENESGDFYASSSWKDDYCLAAALLYKATGESSYATAYNSNNDNSGNIQKTHDWDNVYQLASFFAPTKNQSEWNTINNWLAGVANSSSDSYYFASQWGSARYNCNTQFIALVYDKLNNQTTYGQWARYQMSVILGNNSTGLNLVCGYNENSPKYPHHRAASGYATTSGSSGWNGFNNNSSQTYTLYGALVGGPKTSEFSSYVDSVNDYITNEVTLDYNAGLVSAAAALYLQNKNSTDAGFTSQTVLSGFYGGSSFVDKFSSDGGNSSVDDKKDENTTTEQPTTEQPTIEQPTTEQPKTEQPTIEQPTTEQPKTEQPTTEQPKTEQPTTEENPTTTEEKTTTTEEKTTTTENPTTETSNKTSAVKKGTKKVINKATYKVTKVASGSKAGEVTYLSYKKATGKVTIPATVKIDGKTYKVTAVAAKAFYKNTKVTQVTIGSNVKSIGSKAFYGCKKLKTINIKTTKLKKPKVGAKAFKNIYSKATFKCPKSKLSAYKTIIKKKGAPSKAVYKKN